MKYSALLMLLCAFAAQAQNVNRPKPGAIEGEVLLVSRANPKLKIRTFRRLVVYLKTADGRRISPPSQPTEVRQRGARFAPSLLVVARGQTVLFPNDDDLYHNVFSYSKAKRFDLGLFKSGDSRTVRFDKPGVVRIHCSIHESMNATIIVADTKFHVGPINGPGRFTFRGVPPGLYDVLTWHPRFPRGTARVKVVSGQTARVLVQLGKSDAQN